MDWESTTEVATHGEGTQGRDTTLALLVTRVHKILCRRKRSLSITYEFYLMLSTLLRERYPKYFSAVPMSVVRCTMRFSSAWLGFRLVGYRENYQGQGKVIVVPITTWRSGGENCEASLKTIGKAISTRPSGDVRQWGGGMVYPS